MDAVLYSPHGKQGIGAQKKEFSRLEGIFITKNQNREDIMPVVIVEMWEGRTVDQKKKLAEGITSAFENIGTAPEHLHIIMKDNPKSNWAIAGKLCSED